MLRYRSTIYANSKNTDRPEHLFIFCFLPREVNMQKYQNKMIFSRCLPLFVMQYKTVLLLTVNWDTEDNRTRITNNYPTYSDPWEGFDTYYGGQEPAIIFCMVITLLILMFSLWKEAIDCVLNFQFILHILEGLWLIIVCAWMLSYSSLVNIIVAAFLTIQAYDICKQMTYGFATFAEI